MMLPFVNISSFLVQKHVTMSPLQTNGDWKNGASIDQDESFCQHIENTNHNYFSTFIFLETNYEKHGPIIFEANSYLLNIENNIWSRKESNKETDLICVEYQINQSPKNLESI
jgi:hypothetical protein